MNYDEYGPWFSSLYSFVAVRLHSAKGSHMCSNAMPPTCMIPETDEIMKKVALLIDMERRHQ